MEGGHEGVTVMDVASTLDENYGCCVSDPDPNPNPVRSVFNLSRDPDPYSESRSGFWIQMSKNRFKKPKFTMTDFKDKNRKMLRLS
jgi:hypothetical protein